jgi:carboxylate-amine ligase
MGLSSTLVHPGERDLRPARDVLEALAAHVHDVLEEAGDVERVADGIARVARAGGATRQRAAYERSGSVEGVVDDLLARTEASWNG